MNKIILVALILNLSALCGFAQVSPQPPATITYPRVTGYVGIVHPLVTFSNDGNHTNFDGTYTVGMPTGINLWKSAKIGFSMEFVPFIQATSATNKMSNFLFHPGVLLPIGKGYTFVGRAAFETSGRYGVTPILNKVIKKNKHSNYFLALPLPLRFGNNKAASFGIGFQFGLGF
jgi:hypothetical protein